MSDTLVAAIVGAIAGIITGAFGSLLAPWVNWGFEKRKLRLANRRELISNWRGAITQTITEQKASQWKLDNWTPDYAEHTIEELGQSLNDWAEFNHLKAYLSQSTLAKLNKASSAIWNSDVEDALNSVLDEIRKLERKWGLI